MQWPPSAERMMISPLAKCRKSVIRREDAHGCQLPPAGGERQSPLGHPKAVLSLLINPRALPQKCVYLRGDEKLDLPQCPKGEGVATMTGFLPTE